jgi:hypothetical protein
VVITGGGAVCASGNSAGTILDAIVAGRSAIAPIAQWDTTGWPVTVAAEVADFNPRALVEIASRTSSSVVPTCSVSTPPARRSMPGGSVRVTRSLPMRKLIFSDRRALRRLAAARTTRSTNIFR